MTTETIAILFVVFFAVFAGWTLLDIKKKGFPWRCLPASIRFLLVGLFIGAALLAVCVVGVAGGTNRESVGASISATAQACEAAGGRAVWIKMFYTCVGGTP